MKLRISVLLSIIALVMGITPLIDTKSTHTFIGTALASDEDDAAERLQKAARGEREDEEEYEDRKSTTRTQTEQVTATTEPSKAAQIAAAAPVAAAPVYETLTRYISIIDSGYDTDSDADGLVDAVDPDPMTPQDRYFTDSDGDGVCDAKDAYPDADDFLVQPDSQDQDGNGVLDWMEGK